MGAEILNTPLGWVVFALIFGVIPVYAVIKSREIYSHLSQHLKTHTDLAASERTAQVNKAPRKRFART
jgi:hypothetical protein